MLNEVYYYSKNRDDEIPVSDIGSVIRILNMNTLFKIFKIFF